MTVMSPQLGPHDLDADQRVTLHGVSWEQYEAILAIRGESSGVRLTYLEGELELMSPSQPHEAIKTCIARLLEAWALEFDIDPAPSGAGSILTHTAKFEPEGIFGYLYWWAMVPAHGWVFGCMVRNMVAEAERRG